MSIPQISLENDTSEKGISFNYWCNRELHIDEWLINAIFYVPVNLCFIIHGYLLLNFEKRIIHTLEIDVNCDGEILLYMQKDYSDFHFPSVCQKQKFPDTILQLIFRQAMYLFTL
jgi:hypothetical protein